MLLGTILLAAQLSPTFISTRFMERVERLARYRLEGNSFKEVGFTGEELETDDAALTPREIAMQGEFFADYSKTVQHSPAVSVNEWWGRTLRRVQKPRGPFIILEGEEMKINKVEGKGWQCRRGSQGKMMEGMAL